MERKAYPYPTVIEDIPEIGLHKGDIIDLQLELLFPTLEESNEFEDKVQHSGVEAKLPTGEEVLITDNFMGKLPSHNEFLPQLPDNWLDYLIKTSPAEARQASLPLEQTTREILSTNFHTVEQNNIFEILLDSRNLLNERYSELLRVAKQMAKETIEDQDVNEEAFRALYDVKKKAFNQSYFINK